MSCIGRYLIMQNTTLFLIQASYNSLDKIWNDLMQMAQSSDHIVLMGDAALHIPSIIMQKFSHLYCLEIEQSLLNSTIKAQIKGLKYTDFADLILQFSRCVSLK